MENTTLKPSDALKKAIKRGIKPSTQQVWNRETGAMDVFAAIFVGTLEDDKDPQQEIGTLLAIEGLYMDEYDYAVHFAVEQVFPGFLSNRHPNIISARTGLPVHDMVTELVMLHDALGMDFTFTQEWLAENGL